MLHQVEIKDGLLRKSQPVASYVAGSVAVDKGVTFIGDYDGKFTCMDLKSGKELWFFQNKDNMQPFVASPALSDKRVYAGSRDKYIYALNRKDGSMIWKKNMFAPVDASPVLVGDRLLIASMRGDLSMLNVKDGSVEWTYEIGRAVASNPAVVNGHIIVGSDDGRVYCFGKK